MYLPLLLDTVGSLNSREASIGWLLPAGGWLLPAGIVVPVSAYRPKAAAQALIMAIPANGHSWVTTCVIASSRACRIMSHSTVRL